MFKEDFYRNSFLLTISNLTTGIIKFMFSIILSNRLGSQGVGLYSLIMPIYDFFAVIVCGGMLTALSKESAYYYGKNDFNNLHKAIKISLLFDLIWSFILGIFIFILSPHICKYIIKDNRALFSICIISICIIFVSLSSILKGYFLGISKVKIPAYIDIAEKITRILTIIFVFNYFNIKNLTIGVTITYLSLCLGEIISFILLFYFYKKDKCISPFSFNNNEKYFNILKSILSISIPLCINGILTTGLYTLSTLMLPRRLVETGMSHTYALSSIGKFSGMAMPIIFFPFIVITSISTLLIPDISENLSKNDSVTIERRVKEVFKISFLMGNITFVICLSMSKNLGMLFFNRNDLSNYIKWCSIIAPSSYIASTSYAILNGFGKQTIVLRNSILSASLELILIYFLTAIPKINIKGYSISILFSSIFSLLFNFKEIKKHIRLKITLIDLFIYILYFILIYLLLKILNTLFISHFNTIKCILLLLISFTLIIPPYSFKNKFN